MECTHRYTHRRSEKAVLAPQSESSYLMEIQKGRHEKKQKKRLLVIFHILSIFCLICKIYYIRLSENNKIQTHQLANFFSKIVGFSPFKITIFAR